MDTIAISRYLMISVELKEKRHVLCCCGTFNSVEEAESYMAESKLSEDFIRQIPATGSSVYTVGDMPNYYILFDMCTVLYSVDIGKLTTL